MNKKQIYCYNIDDVDRHILENILSKMNISLSLLDDGMLERTVGELLEDQELTSNQDSTRYDTAFMLMNNISDEELTSILAQGQEVQWDYNPVKMMVTEHNRKWKLNDLFCEVRKEHQLFARAEYLSGLIRKADQTEQKDWDLSRTERCNEALMKGYVMLKNGDFEEAKLNQVIAELEDCLG